MFTLWEVKLLGRRQKSARVANKVFKYICYRGHRKKRLPCFWCDRPMFSYEATVDHIIPRYRGGADIVSNMQLACHNCNRRRGDISSMACWLLSPLLNQRKFRSLRAAELPLLLWFETRYYERLDGHHLKVALAEIDEVLSFA